MVARSTAAVLAEAVHSSGSGSGSGSGSDVAGLSSSTEIAPSRNRSVILRKPFLLPW